MDIRLILVFCIATAVTYFSIQSGRKKERRDIAEKLFARAEALLAEERPDAAGAVLGCVPWNTHKRGKDFQEFLLKITHKKYDDLCLRIDTALAKEKAKMAEVYFAQGLLYESAQNWYESAELMEEIDPEQARIWRDKCENAEQIDDGITKK